jgi:uncharacterized protein with HEPN domain
MQLEVQKYLYDIEQAAARLRTFVSGKSLEGYLSDDMLRAAVERQFEIIGEAVGKMAGIDSESAGRIRNYRQLIAFRNVLIHGYAEVDDRLVWDLIESHLPLLLEDIESLKS